MLQKLRLFYKKLRLRNLISNTDFDQPEFHLIKTLLQIRPTTAIDAGASFGVYSAFMSRYCNTVHAFEPVPLSFSILSYQLIRNQIKNVVAHQSALSDRTGQRTMHIPKMSGTINYYRAGFETRSQEDTLTVEVASTTLDKFSEKISDCTFIKIDVEGHEQKVLNGGMNTINSYKPSLLIELNDPHSESSKAVIDKLHSAGYTCYFLNSDNVYEVWSDNSESKSVNYIFLQKNHLDSVRESAPKLLG